MDLSINHFQLGLLTGVLSHLSLGVGSTPLSKASWSASCVASSLPTCLQWRRRRTLSEYWRWDGKIKWALMCGKFRNHRAMPWPCPNDHFEWYKAGFGVFMVAWHSSELACPKVSKVSCMAFPHIDSQVQMVLTALLMLPVIYYLAVLLLPAEFRLEGVRLLDDGHQAKIHGTPFKAARWTGKSLTLARYFDKQFYKIYMDVHVLDATKSPIQTYQFSILMYIDVANQHCRHHVEHRFITGSKFFQAKRSSSMQHPQKLT